MSGCYWVALLRKPDGRPDWVASYGNTQAEALSSAQKHGVVESIESRPEPVWNILGPVLGHPEGGYGGRYSARYHLLAGGTILGLLDGLEYAMVPTIYRKDQFTKDENGKRMRVIGEVTMHAGEGRPTRRVFLEPLDESHALDLLNGELLTWHAELAALGLLPASLTTDNQMETKV